MSMTPTKDVAEREIPDELNPLPLLMEPQPQWEEAPVEQWDVEKPVFVGRFRFLRQGYNGEPEVDVDVDLHRVPDGLVNVEPIEIDGKWFWNRRSK